MKNLSLSLLYMILSKRSKIEMRNETFKIKQSHTMTEKRAYVTMITSDSFVPGVECMLFSLKETKTKIPVVLIVTEQVSKRNIEKLRSKADRVIVVDVRFFYSEFTLLTSFH